MSHLVDATKMYDYSFDEILFIFFLLIFFTYTCSVIIHDL